MASRRARLRDFCLALPEGIRRIIITFTPDFLYLAFQRNEGMRDKEFDIAYFLSFCIELYGKRHRLSGEEVVALFDRYEVLPYLEANFEALHTQGHQWLMEEIDELISNRKKEMTK